jgi:hypothetical protein
MVTAETTQVLAVIVSFGGADGLERWTQRMSALFMQYAAAKNIEEQIIQ